MGAKCTQSGNGIGVQVLHLSEVDGILSVVVVGNTATLTVTIPNGGEWWYDIWLVNGGATDVQETTNLPSSVTTHWNGVTNTSGIAVIALVNTLAEKTYRFLARFHFVNRSDSFDVGT